MADRKNIKPTQIEDLKKGPHDLITENQFERWQAVILTHIKKDTKLGSSDNSRIGKEVSCKQKPCQYTRSHSCSTVFQYQ